MTSVSDRIRARALSLPSTDEDEPWGFPVFKVADNKLFAMMTHREHECEPTVEQTDEERIVAVHLRLRPAGVSRRPLRTADCPRRRRIAAIGAGMDARALLVQSPETRSRCA
jgi:hypothetical protein